MSDTLFEQQPRLTLIDTQPFEALEAKIAQVLERLTTLQAERNELQKQVTAWQSRSEETARQLDEISREREALKRNQRNPEQEELIRTKITALLAKLEAA
jgi:FtsZ-binding cell division protein ZapB